VYEQIVASFSMRENVPSRAIPDIIAWLSGQGDILYQRALWTGPSRTPRHGRPDHPHRRSVLIQQFTNGEDQVIDKAFMIDAVRPGIGHPEIDTFAIVASEQRIYMLSMRLREAGQETVIGSGEKAKCKPIGSKLLQPSSSIWKT
jgi:hypothetical protein